ncbi:MAG: signal peptidase II [Epulopiscium sp. Nele67-Bin004]|nr:MAG: signal peptidase II [Epulopiscium sp. Nele67-Bin004]
MIYLLIILLVGLDQWTKYWALTELKFRDDIVLWENVFHLKYVENRGAAFGMMQDRQVLFIVITAIVLITIVRYWRHIPKNVFGRIYKISLILIVSGALGNLIDRALLGYVVDLFYFVLIDFPVFNVADICVVAGTIIFCITMILEEIQQKKQARINSTITEGQNQ